MIGALLQGVAGIAGAAAYKVGEGIGEAGERAGGGLLGGMASAIGGAMQVGGEAVGRMKDAELGIEAPDFRKLLGGVSLSFGGTKEFAPTVHEAKPQEILGTAPVREIMHNVAHVEASELSNLVPIGPNGNTGGKGAAFGI